MRRDKKGFTLAELLIVVAIIAVLVAVAIPVFTAQLEKARRATDVANLRAMYAEASAAMLTGEAAPDDFSPYGGGNQDNVDYQWAQVITFRSNGLTDEDWDSLPFDDIDQVGVAINPGQVYKVGFAFFNDGTCGIFDAN